MHTNKKSQSNFYCALYYIHTVFVEMIVVISLLFETLTRQHFVFIVRAIMKKNNTTPKRKDQDKFVHVA